MLQPSLPHIPQPHACPWIPPTLYQLLSSDHPGTTLTPAAVACCDLPCLLCSTAYVTCLELMDAADSRGRILATNIFEKQEGKWKLVHHHGSPLRSSF